MSPRSSGISWPPAESGCGPFWSCWVRSSGMRRAGAVDAAVLAELVHVSSLYHDDVIDNADTRHGAASANARWGNRRAVFAGDWLLAQAAQLACELGPHAVRMNAVTADRLVRGQMLELLGPDSGTAPLDHYFQVTAGKSASLIALSLRLGALQAGASAAYVDALAEYGEQLGLAFQISDDLLDIGAPASSSGKDRERTWRPGAQSPCAARPVRRRTGRR
ncbi:polyprenyl synthetase family protein [Streptomyces sp. INA 01156]